jgi:dTDP-4-amino-4,6-dideoxygalactose transaminase
MSENRLLELTPAIAGGPPAFDELLPIVLPEGLPGEEFLAQVGAIVASGHITNASRVGKLEQGVAEFLGVPYCLAVSSCTSGLLLTLRALALRGEVILPSFTFHATAHSIVWNGLRPVFADCDPETFCLSPKSVTQRLSPNTAAILAVHMHGNPVAVEELQAIADARGVPLILDAAHAFGSRRNGRPLGGFGVAEVFSLSPTKLLVAAEGGIVATRDESLARAIRAGRNYGDSGSYDPECFGLNARMSELHAALALAGLEGITHRIERRNEIRERYQQHLAAIPGLRFQQIRAEDLSTCKDFSVLVDAERFGASRDWLCDALRRENIDVRRYFWPPVHRQKLYRELWDGQPLPCTDFVSESVVSLPIYSRLSDSQVDRVCDAIQHLHQFAQAGGKGTCAIS